MDPRTALMAAQVGMQAYSAFGGGGGGRPDYGRIDAAYTRRRQEIGDFSNQLAAARQKYMSSLTNMYQNSFSNFVPIAETKFANRGLSPIGGAYQSALARETANYQAQLAPKEAEWERADAMAVDNAYAAAIGMQSGANQAFPMAGFAQDNANSSASGKYFMDLSNQYMASSRPASPWNNPNDVWQGSYGSPSNQNWGMYSGQGASRPYQNKLNLGWNN